MVINKFQSMPVREIITIKLYGGALDYYVALILSKTPLYSKTCKSCFIKAPRGISVEEFDYVKYKPSSLWSHGGPIIENENITTDYCGTHTKKKNKVWMGRYGPDTDNLKTFAYGDSALQAAMRCFAVKYFGEKINLNDFPLRTINHDFNS